MDLNYFNQINLTNSSNEFGIVSIQPWMWCSNVFLEIDFCDELTSLQDLSFYTNVIGFSINNKSYNGILQNQYKFPSSIRFLELNFNKFNKLLDLSYLNNLLILNLDGCIEFNEPLFNLPNSLVELILGPAFNQSLDYLPINLEKLYICSNGDISQFNQPLDNLPKRLKWLWFFHNSKFNQPINNLPDSIEVLNLGQSFNHPIDNLPENLIFLSFGYALQRIGLDSAFNCKINNLPRNLKFLILGNNFNHSINNLPKSIEVLAIFNFNYNCTIQRLPKKLSRLFIKKHGGEDYSITYEDQFSPEDNTEPNYLKNIIKINNIHEKTNVIYIDYEDTDFIDICGIGPKYFSKDDVYKDYTQKMNICGFL